ncbi:uncharacterized protein LOC123502133 [Portunus trituberculatus]|uniref:uncharacterized protein LOC123502133 n=1 Tax=Portunus trituberculatus TaxID=210409 RepID=UPI001E1CEC81|nr:uncharacterized protein LOC123502133 [Portunus trituberculatus]
MCSIKVRQVSGSTHLPAHLSTHLPAHLSAHLSKQLSTHLSKQLFTHLPAHLSTHLPAHLSTHLSKHLSLPHTAPRSVPVHGTYRKSQYHFSWKAQPGRVFTWSKGDEYCTSLGPGWELVSLELPDENFYISQVVARENIKYIWLGGFREPGSRFFVWLSGGAFKGYNWSSTGGRGVPQPDNREGNEYYIALLNNIYKDGIKWHDIANSHEKPVICERMNLGAHNA